MDGWVRLMQLRYPLLFLAQPGCQRQVQYYGSERYATQLLGHTANMQLIMVPVLAGSPPFWAAAAAA